jgi:alkanesulfonate monooxygenase SsuD/methylene tetrahydromethanopterin reductase-like flavin-dependent oxidoreductase (luciferase family)
VATLGFIIPQRGATFGLGDTADLLRLGVRAEQTGLFDTLWVGDSLTSKSRPEALMCLGALAGMTDRVRLGVGCLGSFAVRDPALFALQWATLDQVSGGRALLAVCNGLQKRNAASEKEGANFGGVRDADRSGLVEEYLGLCRRLWAGEAVDYVGSHVTYSDLQLEITPVQKDPAVWLSANPPIGRLGQRVVQRAARLTDGLLTSRSSESYARDLRAQLVEALEEADRDTSTFEFGLYHGLSVGADREACLTEARRFYDSYYGEGMIDDAAASAMTIAGPPERCADEIRSLVDQGATHIAFRLPSWDQRGKFDAAVEQVLAPLVSEGVFESPLTGRSVSG